MGSKHRLLPWIHSVLKELDFETAADPFVGSGCVAYLMKAMDRQVLASDFLNFPVTIAAAAIENSFETIDSRDLKRLLAPAPDAPDFIAQTFKGIFFTAQDRAFLDRVCSNLRILRSPAKQALASAALIRACIKKQPRGVFTIGAGRYDDGRRDLRLAMEEHFIEQIQVYNGMVFNNGRRNTARRTDVFNVDPGSIDLVYLDPPYVPRSDDNCYIKRYHFVEGLSRYWQDMPVLKESKVRKIAKQFTPFSYRRTAIEAFDQMFAQFRRSTIVLSYSSNGFPDVDTLQKMLRKHKRRLDVYERRHRYHFGTHGGVRRAEVNEYLIVAR